MEDRIYTTQDGSSIHYKEYGNSGKNLLFIHAQGTSMASFYEVANDLDQKAHVYLVDCYGHGRSSHDPAKYNLKAIGDDLIEFMREVIGGPAMVIGHSSGGLIAAYMAANSALCQQLILEDPPLFSSCGERRYKTYHYLDLATVCHNFLQQEEETDFVLYYFMNQYCWRFFPDKTREKTRAKLGKNAAKFRRKHPHADLKVMFWPQLALEGFRGMGDYDPRFGQTFYDDSFHAGIDYEALLSEITCETLIMKARDDENLGKHNIDETVLMAAMSDEDLIRANKLIKGSSVQFLRCGHGIHMEKYMEYIKTIKSLI